MLCVFLYLCPCNRLPLNLVHLQQPYEGRNVLLSNPCASFNPKLCQDLGETEHPLTAGAPPKTCFSCPVEAPCTGDTPLAKPSPLPPSSPSAAIKDSFIICWLILRLPPGRLPGNGSPGSPSSPSPHHNSRSETLRPLGRVHPLPPPPQQRTLSLAFSLVHPPPPAWRRGEGEQGRGKGRESSILNLCSRRGASAGTGGDTTFECTDRGHTVVPLQLNYPVHNGEASRIDTSIESVSAALWGPTISISAEIDLLPRGATIAGQSF